MKNMRLKGMVIIAAVMMIFGLTSGPASAYYSYGNSKDSNTCSHGSCKSKKMTGSSYCSSHTCSKGSCKKKTLSGSSYCSSHTCSYPGCNRMVNSANQKCAAHKGAEYPSSGKSSYSGTYTYHSNSSKKQDEYNASEYDDYEDFYEDYYDDFDGIDDAEEYWEEYH